MASICACVIVDTGAAATGAGCDVIIAGAGAGAGAGTGTGAGAGAGAGLTTTGIDGRVGLPYATGPINDSFILYNEMAQISANTINNFVISACFFILY
jgi:hypothetical protein